MTSLDKCTKAAILRFCFAAPPVTQFWGKLLLSCYHSCRIFLIHIQSTLFHLYSMDGFHALQSCRFSQIQVCFLHICTSGIWLVLSFVHRLEEHPVGEVGSKDVAVEMVMCVVNPSDINQIQGDWPCCDSWWCREREIESMKEFPGQLGFEPKIVIKWAIVFCCFQGCIQSRATLAHCWN